jgi:selenocysteine lyase/cysteine desulfurase
LIRSANRFDQNACVGPSLFGWNATLKFLEGLGKKNIERRVRYLGGYLIKELQNIGCKVHTPGDPLKRHGLIVYTTGSYERDLKSLNGITCPPSHRKPIKVTYRSQGGVSGIRVCTHFFNTEEDIDQLIKVQKELL